MKVFHVSCIDNETKNELLASECSYNQACGFLMQNGFTDPIKTESDLRYTRLYFEKGRIFIYDEQRGYLLQEV